MICIDYTICIDYSSDNNPYNEKSISWEELYNNPYSEDNISVLSLENVDESKKIMSIIDDIKSGPVFLIKELFSNGYYYVSGKEFETCSKKLNLNIPNKTLRFALGDIIERILNEEGYSNNIYKIIENSKNFSVTHNQDTIVYDKDYHGYGLYTMEDVLSLCNSYFIDD